MNGHTENHLFIVETPFQLFSALCFFEANRERFNRENVDIAVYAQFEKADDYVYMLRDTGVFRNVFYIRPYHERVTREGLTYISKMLFSPKKRKKRFFETCPDIALYSYSHLYVAGATRFPLDVKLYCATDARTVLFDDGTGSRNGAIIKAFLFMDPIGTKGISFSREDYLKLAAKRVVDKLARGKFRLDSDELWVFSPEKDLQDKLPQLDIHEIPKHNMRSQLVKRVICADPSKEEDAHIIYFAAPLTTAGGIPEIQDKVIALFEDKGEWGAKVRRHPRGFDMPVPEILRSTNEEACWEALWGSWESKEDMILMGFGSTAQITPKILYGDEPYQVFLHKLLPYDSPVKTAAQDAMNELMRRYSRTDRILSPNSFDELIEIINMILGERKQESPL